MTESALSDCVTALRSGKAAALLLGGPALLEHGLRAGASIAASTGCRLLCDTFPARLERGAGLPLVEKLPYFPEQAIEMLSRFAFLILAGTSEPVSFFGYPGIPSRLTPAECAAVVLSRPDEDTVGALEALAGRLNAGKDKGIAVPAGRPARPVGALTPRSLGEAVAALQPEGTIIMDEGATSGLPHFLVSAGAPRFTYLTITGGAIGQGLPCATGAALACPDRRVVALQADGSGMYTLAGSLDPGSRGTRCHDDCVRQQELPGPAGRTRPRRRDGARAAGSRPYRSYAAGDRLGRAGARYGRTRRAGRDGRRARA